MAKSVVAVGPNVVSGLRLTGTVNPARQGIRARLVMLVATAVLPLLLMAIYSTWQSAERANAQLRGSLISSAAMAEAVQNQLTSSMLQLLEVMSTVPALKSGDPAQCQRYLDDVRARVVRLASLGLADADGRLRCSSPRQAPDVRLVGLKFFDQALTQGQRTATGFMVDRLTGLPALTVALPMPVVGNATPPSGVLVVSVNLAALNARFRELKLPPGQRLSVMDGQGVVLIAPDDDTGQIGKVTPDPLLLRRVLDNQLGMSEQEARDDVSRLTFLARTDVLPGQPMYIAVGQSRPTVLGLHSGNWTLEVTVLVLVALAGIYAAWALGGRTIVAPTSQILDATRHLRRGLLDTRIAMEPLSKTGEFERIASSFNLMAESLQLRRNELEKELSNSRQAYIALEMVVNSMQDGLVAVDGGGHYLMSNAVASQLLGPLGSDVPLNQWPQTYGFYQPGSDTPCDWQGLPLQMALQGRSGDRLEFDLRNAVVGSSRRIRCSYRPIKGEAGIAGALMLFSDVSHIAQMEQTEERFAVLFAKGPLPMWVFDATTTEFLAVNEAAQRQYGYSEEEFRAMSLVHIRPQSEQDRFLQHLAASYTGLPEAWMHRRKDGTEFWAEIVSRPVAYNGRSARFVVAQDISSRIKAEEVAREHLFTLQRAADAASAIVQHQSLQGTLQEVVDQARSVIRAHQCAVSLSTGDERALSLCAVSPSTGGASWLQPGSTEPAQTALYTWVRETNKPMRLTQQVLQSDPRWRDLADQPIRGWMGAPLISRQGANMGVLQLADKFEGEFSLQDEYVAMEMAQLASIAIENARLFEQITELNSGLERKVIERTARLSEQEALFRALAEQAPQVVWTYETGRGVTYVNRFWYELIGGKPEDWLNSNNWLERLHPEDREPMLAAWAACQIDKTTFSGIRRLLSRDGSYRTMSYKCAPVLAEDGSISFWVGIDADITDIKVIEDALRQSNEELEAFSYSVSHDLRSPLSVVDGFSRLLAKQLGDAANDKKVQHYLTRIQAGVAHMGQLIEALLSLAHVSRAMLSRASVDVSQMARDIFEDLKAAEPDRQIDLQVEAGLTLQGDDRLLRVMFNNLLRNAWKFTSRTPEAQIVVGRLTGQDVIYCRDNGAGFDMAYADKLFGVFQRLHGANDFPGTGIGLATVHRIVTRHAGRVWADAKPGGGATFFIELPRTASMESVPD